MTTDIVNNRLAECENIIERGLNTFVEVGAALLEIRDNRLYKNNYSTFEDYCRDRWGMVASRARQLIASAEVVGNLKTVTNVTLLPINEGQARPLVSLPPETQKEVWMQAIETAPKGKITATHIQQTVDKVTKALPSYNTGENEWYTPPEYIDAAKRVMKTIDTDPASSEIANQTIKAKIYYTKETDGRKKNWKGNVWLNPPYAQPLISEFSETFIEKYTCGEFNQACVLVNNATETNWYQNLLEHADAVCFVKGRIKFLDKNGIPGAPLQGQTILYFGENKKLFCSIFSEFGKVLYGS